MIGDRIRVARAALKMTQQELADIVGISRPAINRIENNKTPKLRASTAFSIAQALKVSMDFLFCDYCLGNESEGSKR